MGFVSNDGKGHLILLPKQSRERLSATLVDAFDAFRPVVRHCLERGPATSTPAARLAEYKPSQELASTETPTTDALERIVFACQAGLDHARIAAASLPDERASFGIVTLARGCLESYAKAWWLMEPTEELDILIRYMSSLTRELELRTRLDPDAELLSVVDGSARRVAEMNTEVGADLTLLTNGGRPPRATDTDLAAAFGDALGGNGRHTYSLLSSVAHGEALGLGDFVGITTGTRTTRYTTGMPAWLAEECASLVFSATSLAFRRLSEFYGFTDPDGKVGRAHDAALVQVQQEREKNASYVHRSVYRHRQG